VLKSIVFLLVLISFITTPTQAYEAYNNITSLLILKDEVKTQNIIEKALPTKEASLSDTSYTTSMPQNYELCQIAIKEIETSHHIKESEQKIQKAPFLTIMKKQFPQCLIRTLLKVIIFNRSCIEQYCLSQMIYRIRHISVV
jgi:hypothetical protein